MKIAVLSTPFASVPPSGAGGIERFVHELTEGLVDRGHDVTLYATADSTTRARLVALEPHAAGPPDLLRHQFHSAWALHAALAEPFEVFHVQSAADVLLSRFVGRRAVVCTLHDPCAEEVSRRVFARMPEVFYVAVSRDQVERELPLPRLRVIHHGLAPADYPAPADSQGYACFLGRLAPVKGAHLAIDVAAAAGLPIRIAGGKDPGEPGYFARELQPRLGRPGVEWLGEVGMEGKVALLRNARVLLSPHRWAEPFGLAMVEAMLCGCPVVASALGSAPELVDEGVTGFVARSTREMARLIAPGGPLDGLDRGRCRQRAVERFGRARMVAEYEALYAEACAAAARDAYLR